MNVKSSYVLFLSGCGRATSLLAAHAIGASAKEEHIMAKGYWIVQSDINIEFPDYASAQACYHDPDYEDAHKLRSGAAVGDVVVEGYDGPQPVTPAPSSAEVRQ